MRLNILNKLQYNYTNFVRQAAPILLLGATFFVQNTSLAAPPELLTADVLVEGRVAVDETGWHATWPGTYLTTQFSGQAIGIVIDDAHSGYTVDIDGGKTQFIAAHDGQQIVWIRDLHQGHHQLQLIRRNESPELPGTIKGFLLDGGKWLPAPQRHKRQIEFIGDSFTAGLGNLSTTHTCNAATLRTNTDASKSFGVQVARHFKADWELNAMSGMGMNRNWNGNRPTVNFQNFYPTLLQNDSTSQIDNTEWHPQLIVIGLGINDFSTPIHEGENWTKESLAAEFVSGYLTLIEDLRSRYGNVPIIATAVRIKADDQQGPLVQMAVNQAHANGDDHLSYLEYQKLELNGCQWHPDLHDHTRMAQALIESINDLGIFAD